MDISNLRGRAKEKPTGGAVLSVTGNRSAVMDGCDGVVDYDAEKIILRTGKLTVRIGGRGLRLTRLTETSAMVEGLIDRIEYSY